MTMISSAHDLDKYKTAVLLKDGSTLFLRPIVRDDEDRLLSLFLLLSRHTVYLRFHGVIKHMSREQIIPYCTVDYNDTFALVATLGEDAEEKIIAVGRYCRLPKRDTAEVAFVVEDAHQGKGIGTQLLEHLAVIAREKGILFFEAEVLAENRQMMKVLQNMGFKIDQTLEYGVFRVVLDIAPTPMVEEKSEERDKIAAIASLRAFLKPSSIAVIGASHKQGTLGYKTFRNILQYGFNGVVYPVNPNADIVASVKAYSSVLDIPGKVDLAIVLVPANMVHKVIQECGRKGVWGAVIISAGFGEVGAEGSKMQEKLVEIACSYGMRLVGPNCMGIINTDPEINLNATFSPIYPPSGNIALCSQSGALGLAILEYANLFNIGLSDFVSIGNRADVSSNDLLYYWKEDPNTQVILLYLESFGNSRKFARIARSVAAKKPIVAVKSGRTPAGSRAAASHTGALAATDTASEALFKQAGIVRVNTLEELFNVANMLSHQPVPAGRRVAILSNGGGPAIMTADACVDRGLELPTLSDNTVSELKQFLPRGSSVSNPIDMTAEAGANDYKKSLELIAKDDSVDNTIVIFVPPIVTQSELVANAIRQVAPQYRQRGKTLLASFMGSRDTNIDLGYEDGQCVPRFAFPEATAIAVSKVCEYGEWLRRPRGTVPNLKGINKEKAERIVYGALGRNTSYPQWLDSNLAIKLLKSYGIKVVKTKSAATPKEAVRLARQIGFPVVMKLLSNTITHKTEVDGVVLDLRSEMEVEQAFNHIKDHLESMGKADEMQGVMVQEMVVGGVEVIAGITQDSSFGPLVLFGLGGIYAELFKDTTFRIHPLTNVDAKEMVRSVKARQLLEGWRGSAPCDIDALEELLLRVSAMVEDIPQIKELDLNPVKVLEKNKGYAVVDVRIILS